MSGGEDESHKNGKSLQDRNLGLKMCVLMFRTPAIVGARKSDLSVQAD